MSEYPAVLVFHEKHGDVYFHIPDEATLRKVALAVLTDRINAEYWYFEESETKARAALKRAGDTVGAAGMQDGGVAWRFLRSRSDYEYEGVALEQYADPEDL